MSSQLEKRLCFEISAANCKRAKLFRPYECIKKRKKGVTLSSFLGDPFVIPRGFEPRTHSLEGCCSIQLSYETSNAFSNAENLVFLKLRVQRYTKKMK